MEYHKYPETGLPIASRSVCVCVGKDYRKTASVDYLDYRESVAMTMEVRLTFSRFVKLLQRANQLVNVVLVHRQTL